MIVASMAVVTARLIDAPPLRSANDRSRWCTVWSLVERGTYQIDEIRRKPGWDTIDLVRHEGHFYSSKPPLLPFVVAHLYLGIRQTTGWTLTDQTELVTRIILFLINIVPMGLALTALRRMLWRHCRDPFGRMMLLTTACWGTLLLPYLTVFNNHTVAATAFVFALVAAVEIVVEGKRTPWRFALCGLMAGWGVANELPSAPLGLALFGLLCRADFRRTLLWFAPLALLPLAGFFVTNYQAAGSWRPFYLAYGTPTYEFAHEGVPSYWMEPKGVDRPRDSTAAYLFHCLLGHHGILSLSPIFLLTLWSWCMPSTWQDRSRRALHLLGVLLTVLTLAFYLFRTANYNYGGVSVALRWSLWLIPFWLFSMGPVLAAFGGRTWFRALAVPLLGVSVFSAWYPANAPWTQPWIFKLLEQAKWIDYSDPRPAFDRRHFSWIGALPDGPLQADYWIRFATTEVDGSPLELLLQDGGPLSDNRRKVIVERTDSQGTARTELVLDRQAFEQGRPVADFLVALGAGPSADPEEARFLQGIPQPAEYFSSRIRYERTGLRRDAFRCHVGYAVSRVRDVKGESRQYVRDVWYCADLPFGVLRWEDRVTSGSQGGALSTRAWRPIAAGRVPPDAPATTQSN